MMGPGQVIDRVQGSAMSPYEILWNTDDHISCNCISWSTGWKKRGSRICKHIDEVVRKKGLMITQRADYWYITGQSMANVKAPKVAKKASWADKAAEKAARRMVAEPERAAPAPVVIGDFVKPMLASKMPDSKTANDYDVADWIMEEKFDGHRIVLRVIECKRGHDIHDGECGNFTAWSRIGNVRVLPDRIAHAVANLIEGVYDGEITVPSGKSYGVTDGANKGTETLVLFDMIEALGQKIGYEQRERRAMLERAYDAIPIGLTIARGNRPVILTEQMPPSLNAVKVIWARGGEGAIIKNQNAFYKPDVRSPDWVKVKKVESAVITVTGYKEGLSGQYSTTIGKDKDGIEIRVKTLDVDELRLAGPSQIGRRLVVTMQERTPDGKARHAMWDHWATKEEE